MYPRKIYPLLKEHLVKKEITVITGMRQTGKTTLVKQLLSDITSDNKMYLDLERIDNREVFSEKNYDTALYALRQRGLDITEKMYVVLDEIQLAPGIPSVLKYLHDNYDIKFIVTGSSSYYIKNLFTESLAGRKKIFELYPLDFGEFLAFKEITFVNEGFHDKKFDSHEYERLKNYYEEYVEYGGFPQIALITKNEDKKDHLSDIISSYINIDVKTLADFRKQGDLYKIMKMLASRCATRIDYAKLSRLAGISRVTLHNYMDFLEKTYLIFRIPVITNNPDREIVKAHKLYFCDNGIMNCLADVSGGIKFENSIFNQLHHKGHVSYYALKNGREIDFILDKDIALEVKESPAESDQKTLANLSNKAKIKVSRLIGRYAMPNFTDCIWAGQIR